MSASNPQPNPYVGPRAFEIGERIFGRDRELRQVFQLLVARRIVLLHSPSGAGKTSLVQAGLIPKLVEDGFLVLPVARLNMEPLERQGGNGLFNRYVFSLVQSLEEDLPENLKIPSEQLAHLSLSDYLALRQEIKDEERLVVLVIDQAEDVLTIDPTDRDQKTAFFTQLGISLRNQNLWALFVIREDYLGALGPYVRLVPTRLSNTYRLDLLGVEAACQAIQKPARLSGVDFTDRAAIKLVDDLREVRVQQPDGTFLGQLGPHVEPVQLQVVCRRLWNNLPPDANQITVEQLENVGDVDQSLVEYYAEQVQKTARETGISERAIRRWFGSKLITPDGLRGQVLMGEDTSGELENCAINHMVNSHLVRAEERRGVTWFELAHDRLVKPVRGNNQDWFEQHLTLLQRQSDLWVQQGRPDGLILKGTALVDAEQWASTHQDSMSKDENDFLAACQKARQLEQAELEAHRQRLMNAQKLADAEKVRAEQQAKAASKLRRQAVILAILLMIAFLTTGLSIYFGLQAQRQKAVAQTAEALAVEQRVVAEAARVNAQFAEATAVMQRAAAETAGFQAQDQYTKAKAVEATVVAERESASTAQALLDMLRATAQAAGTRIVAEPQLESTVQALVEAEIIRSTTQAEEVIILPQKNCDEVDPPCIYTVLPGDSFSQIALKFYGSLDSLPGLLNINRDEKGYRKLILPGDSISIQSRQTVFRVDIPEFLYTECWEGDFPCWYQAEGYETYETIAARFLGDSSLNNIIKNVNWSWDAEESELVNGPPISKGLLLVLPVTIQPPSREAYTCPGAIDSKIKVGIRAYVCTRRDRLITRNDPDPQDQEVFRLYPNTEIEILGGPLCIASANWWQIRVPQGTIVRYGEDYSLDTDKIVWVTEGSDDIDPYYICPLR